MYGLVNNGVRTYVIASHGENVWRKICKHARVPDEKYENLTAYDDAHTYALVGAVAETLDMPAEQVLQVFGEFWVGFSKSSALGKLIDQRCDTLIGRIRGLDEMHERIQLTMPHLNPPSFEFEERADGTHRLHYMSMREGLAPMVVGLLKGMAAECGVTIEITHVVRRSDGADHDVFNLRIASDAD
ncbi:MAG: heme NO-binding domain-containing protein [Candidatus Saccharibacteria bacterium]|nr:heme NO-binding domain-containing protein [Pseudorhodobacter sp.]